MTWVLDAEIHLDAMGLGDAIKDKDKASTQDCAKALIFLRHHLDEGLKIEYLTVKDPFVLWNGLKERYDNLKITSKLKLCGDNISDYDIPEKTFTTFHASNMADITTISGSSNLIEGSGRATITLPMGTIIIIENAMFSSKSKRNLLSFKDIRKNGFHIETIDENNMEYLIVTKNVSGQKRIIEKFPSLSCGLPLGSKDRNPRKRKTNDQDDTTKESHKEIHDLTNPEIHEEINEPETQENKELSINPIDIETNLNRMDIVADYIFAYNVASSIMQESEDLEPQSVGEFQTPNGVKPVGYKWVFVCKRNEKNEVQRYKARLVAQEFSQRPGVDYEETYSPVMGAITFRYLISFAVHEKLDMHLMDVVTAYLYGSLDNEIYMKIPEGFKMPNAQNSNSRETFSIKLQRSLYGLRQSGRMWPDITFSVNVLARYSSAPTRRHWNEIKHILDI
ncbi:uncharacterized protein [Nicotiana sylvestris]|uniref:uncharacterized protein n=1 Tax=Nicotiana sylvestris TaxID=4096 RepID=UPI00388CA71B